MLLERYECKVNRNFHRYIFFSKGPKGIIRKRVVYQFFGTFDGKDHYNLSFGDYDEKTDTVNDLSISNNQDRDKILATVAFTAIEFINHVPACRLFVKGSTLSRTRLYQMAIAKYYHEINKIFKIQGFSEPEGWTDFTPGKNYLAFLIIPK